MISHFLLNFTSLFTCFQEGDNFQQAEAAVGVLGVPEGPVAHVRRQRKGYQHEFKKFPCSCGQLKRTPLPSSLEEAEPYIQLGAFSSEQEMWEFFEEKHRTFVYRVKGTKVEFLHVQYAKREKQYIPNYCFPFSNEFRPAEDTQVMTLNFLLLPFGSQKN